MFVFYLELTLNFVGYVVNSHIGEFDKHRTGILPFVFYDNFGYVYLFLILLSILLHFLMIQSLIFFGRLCRFEQYVDYALDVPMVFVYRQNKYIDCRDMSFRVIISQISHYLPLTYSFVQFIHIYIYLMICYAGLHGR